MERQEDLRCTRSYGCSNCCHHSSRLAWADHCHTPQSSQTAFCIWLRVQLPWDAGNNFFFRLCKLSCLEWDRKKIFREVKSTVTDLMCLEDSSACALVYSLFLRVPCTCFREKMCRYSVICTSFCVKSSTQWFLLVATYWVLVLPIFKLYL